MPLRLVHVSDIHFRGYDGGWDLNSDQRNELLLDVVRIVEESGPIDGILVGGDIAFRASEDEYEIAAAWLDELRLACGGLDTGRVWTVPGNHDVHRATVGASEVLQEFRSSVRGCDLNELDDRLNRRLAKDPAAAGLSLPLKAYNKFAGQYTCSVTSREPHWYDEALQFDGLRVHLLGVNSVLISDHEDGDEEERSKLVLGTYQCVVPRGHETVNVTIMHHPPSWIRDWSIVEPYLRRSHLLLFGHEHAYSAQQLADRGTVEIYAGAVGPERNVDDEEDQYLPTYNVLSLGREDADTVSVKVEPRMWDADVTRFVGHPDGVTSFQVSIANPSGLGESAPIVPNKSLYDLEAVHARSANPLGLPDADGQANSADGSSRTGVELRRLGTQFMRRPWTDRIAIARGLGVLQDEDLQLDAAELFPLLLARMRERDLISKLEQELES